MEQIIKSCKNKGSRKCARTKKEEDKVPLIATKDGTKDEADRQHVAHLPILSNKEEIIEGVHNRVRGAVIGIVLKTADATNNKDIDDIEVHKLLRCGLDAAKCPAAVAACNKYVTLIYTKRKAKY